MPHSWQPEPPTGLFWPLALVAALLVGVLISLLCLRYDVMKERYRVEAGAFAEASIAICSGALLWIGWWDFVDSYLVPTEWWAKLCMLFVGGVGTVLTRSLYADLQRPHAVSAQEGTSVCVEDGIEDPPPPPRAGMPPLLEAMSPRPRSFGAEDEFDDVALRGTPGFTPGRVVASSRRTLNSPRGGGGSSVGDGVGGGSGACPSWCFLNPPRFSCSRCARALLATFSGLTMWVGLWDLLESHILPTLFTACKHEPSSGCAVVKLSLVGVGAVGLYLTRALYGDHGVGAVQFQRL